MTSTNRNDWRLEPDYSSCGLSIWSARAALLLEQTLFLSIYRQYRVQSDESLTATLAGTKCFR